MKHRSGIYHVHAHCRQSMQQCALQCALKGCKGCSGGSDDAEPKLQPNHQFWSVRTKKMQMQASECKNTAADAYLCGRRSSSNISFAEQEAAVACACSTDATAAYPCRRRCTTAYLHAVCVFWRKQNTFYTGEQRTLQCWTRTVQQNFQK